MWAIGFEFDWPSQEEIDQSRLLYQKNLLEDIWNTVWDHVIEVWEIVDKTIWFNWKKIVTIVTPEWKQYICLHQSIIDAQDKTRIWIANIFVTWYDIQSTSRFDQDWIIPRWTIIWDIHSTSDSPSGSSNKIWTKSSRGWILLDSSAYPVDIEYEVNWEYRDYMQRRSISSYSISPTDEVIANMPFKQCYVID